LDWLSRGLDSLLQLWERGKALLWALAIICAAVFAILSGGAFSAVNTYSHEPNPASKDRQGEL
jgi:predicted membrane metal-binding protein